MRYSGDLIPSGRGCQIIDDAHQTQLDPRPPRWSDGQNPIWLHRCLY